MQRWLPVVCGVATLVAGCAPGSDQDSPAFVARLIDQMKAAPVTNPPASIWKYRYLGRTVYYVPPFCCDVPSELYDADGNLICSPDGGLTGAGDGKCPDFFDKRTDELRLWRDSRAR
jgi:hypothetical protein